MSPGKQITIHDEGYYYSIDRTELILAEAGDTLPEAENWEYLGSAKRMTPADAVDALEERYPDISVELTFRHA